MVVKSEIKHIKSLQQKKYRTQNGLFVAEGSKMVSELLGSRFDVHKIYSTDESLLAGIAADKMLITPSELKKISNLQSPNKILGVFHIPEPGPVEFTDWILALDAVQDPGNLGTIIRLCDWFGIKHLVCSPDTVDCYNPKVLQATMGSIGRVNVVYMELHALLKTSILETFGAFVEGNSIYRASIPSAGILVMGNEAHGISESVSEGISSRISIPQFGPKNTESLNVATATAILLHELRRSTQK